MLRTLGRFSGLWLLSLALAAPAFAGQTYTLSGFDAVEVHSGIQIDLAQGAFAVERTTDNPPDDLSVTVEGRTLKLEFRKKSVFSWFSWGNLKTVRFRITLPELQSLELSGGSGAQVRNLQADRLELNLSGGAQLKGSVKAGRLTANLSGGSGAALEGSAGTLGLEASGGAWFRSPSFLAQDAEIDVSGGSGARLGLGGSVRLSASGGASIEYSGSPRIVSQDSSGGASIRGRS